MDEKLQEIKNRFTNELAGVNTEEYLQLDDVSWLILMVELLKRENEKLKNPQVWANDDEL